MAAVTICSDFGAPKNKVWHCFHCFPIYFHEVMGPDAMIFIFWMLSFKPTFSLSILTFINWKLNYNIILIIKVKYCNSAFSLFEFCQAIVCSCHSSTSLFSFFLKCLYMSFIHYFLFQFVKKFMLTFSYLSFVFNSAYVWGVSELFYFWYEHIDCFSHSQWLSSINFMLRKILFILGKYWSSLIFSSSSLLFY